MDIKSFFQEWDRHRHFKVSPKQFRQTLASCKFTLTEDEFAALVAHYKEPSTGDIMYMEFLHAASPSKYPLEPGKVTSNNFGEKFCEASKTCGKIPTYDLVMTRIKNVVKQNRIRVEEFFLDHDPLRKGDVSSAKFRTCLDELKYFLSKRE